MHVSSEGVGGRDLEAVAARCWAVGHTLDLAQLEWWWTVTKIAVQNVLKKRSVSWSYEDQLTYERDIGN